MTEQELIGIEANLKIALPTEYRDLMLACGASLRTAGCFSGDFSRLCLESSQIVSDNQLERAKDSGTAYAFPEWWKKFFLIGTNGAGDYFCLRLDDTPGVWMVGSDCGDEPSLMAKSLRNFVDEAVRKHEEEEERADRRHTLFHDEVAAERGLRERVDGLHYAAARQERSEDA